MISSSVDENSRFAEDSEFNANEVLDEVENKIEELKK